MKPTAMDLKRAVQDLDEHGSADDPIIYRGEETTPNELPWKLDEGIMASSIPVRYWGMRFVGGPVERIKRGSLSGMVRERRWRR